MKPRKRLYISFTHGGEIGPKKKFKQEGRVEDLHRRNCDHKEHQIYIIYKQRKQVIKEEKIDKMSSKAYIVCKSKGKSIYCQGYIGVEAIQYIEKIIQNTDRDVDA